MNALKMPKGGVMEDYLATTRVVKNRLEELGANIVEQTIIQQVLNGLP